jgi:hypothetical protein
VVQWLPALQKRFFASSAMISSLGNSIPLACGDDNSRHLVHDGVIIRQSRPRRIHPMTDSKEEKPKPRPRADERRSRKLTAPSRLYRYNFLAKARNKPRKTPRT